MLRSVLTTALGLTLLTAASASAADAKLKAGKPDLKSAGSITFGPRNILFVGDSVSGAVFAIKVDAPTAGDSAPVNVKGINSKIASALGTTPRDILINDIAAQPGSGRVFLSVSRGRGPKGMPVIVSVAGSSGKISVLSLDKVQYAKATLPNAPPNRTVKSGRRSQNPRLNSITDMHYIDGKLIVAGLSNEEFASNLRIIPYPFKTTGQGATVEIFHGSHGRYETRSPIRTFIPVKIGGKPQVLAAYTCTPLVKFPVADLEKSKKVRGTTVAELGNHNVPLDIIVYSKDGKNYLLMANNKRGVMKIPTAGIDKVKAITKRVSGETAGVSYETIKGLQGVVHLDKLNDTQAVTLVQKQGSYDLKTIDLP